MAQEHPIPSAAEEKSRSESRFDLAEIHTPHYLRCPISKEIMRDPVMLLDDGFTYEREYIEAYLQQVGNAVSPMTGRRLEYKQVKENHFVKEGIDAFYAQHPLLRQKVAPNLDDRLAQFLVRQQDEMEQQKQRRRAPFFTYLQHVKAYLQKRNLLDQHSGAHNYDVFISYAWQDQDKKDPQKMEAHRKLQGFLTCLHDDLQRMGLNVFFDCKDMDRNMAEVMKKSVNQSGIILSICKPFLQQAVKDRPKGNVTLEVNCALERAAKEPEALLPLLCEGEWDGAMPIQMLAVTPIQAGQDVRKVFAEFDRHQPFASTYMEWMVNHLIPRVISNLSIPSNDLILLSMIQLFHSQREQEQFLEQTQFPSQITPDIQFEHNCPGNTAEEHTATTLQAFEFSLKRLAKLTEFHRAKLQAEDSKDDELPEQQVLLIFPSSADPVFAAWIAQFSRHLALAGLTVSHWSGSGNFPQPVLRSVITLCTPDLKRAVETGLDQQGSGWSQLQQHLAQPDVVCYPVIYQGSYGTSVPTWSKNYQGLWQKNFLARNTEGASLEVSKSHYYQLMMGIEPKGLLRDLLRYEDNDHCYNFLYDNFQMMVSGWGTKKLLELERSVIDQVFENSKPRSNYPLSIASPDKLQGEPMAEQKSEIAEENKSQSAGASPELEGLQRALTEKQQVIGIFVNDNGSRAELEQELAEKKQKLSAANKRQRSGLEEEIKNIETALTSLNALESDCTRLERAIAAFGEPTNDNESHAELGGVETEANKMQQPAIRNMPTVRGVGTKVHNLNSGVANANEVPEHRATEVMEHQRTVVRMGVVNRPIVEQGAEVTGDFKASVADISFSSSASNCAKHGLFAVTTVVAAAAVATAYLCDDEESWKECVKNIKPCSIL